MSEQQNTQQPVAWEYFDGTWRIGVDGERENYEMFGYPTRDLYTSPPVPRDVLMAVAEEVRASLSAVVCDSSEPWVASSQFDLDDIVDRYASQVQPEQPDPLDAVGEVMELRAWRAALRGLCVGRELLTPDECAENVRHQLRTVKKADAKPVNQQLLAALKAIKQITDGSQPIDAAGAAMVGASAIAAADAAQPVLSGPAMHMPSGFAFDEVIAAAKHSDLVALTPQPSSAQPDGVPDGWQAAMAFARAALAEAIQIAPLDRLPTMAGAAMQQIDALLSAATKPEGGK